MRNYDRRLPKLDSKKTALEIARLADEKLAERIVVIEIGRLSSVAEYLVICSAPSERQVKAIADNIEDGLKVHGVRPIGVEGVAEARWALIDYGDVVAHVFHGPVRDYYDIDGLWADAPRVDVDLPARDGRG